MGKLAAVIIPVTGFQQNCTLIWDDAALRGTVIDPGGDVPRILSAAAQHGVTIEAILLTHGHVDHAAGAAALKDALGGKVLITGPDERDRFLLDNLENSARQFGIVGARNVTPDRWLAEGETVAIAGRDFAVLHCPGHTPGSLVYVSTAEGIAFVGDVLFRGSVGRTDFAYGDHEALIAAIVAKLLPLGDEIAFICGHGPGSTIGAERRSNPYLPR